MAKENKCTIWAFSDCRSSILTNSKVTCCSFCHEKYFNKENKMENSKKVMPLCKSEVLEFKPTMEKQMEVACFDGRYIHDMEKISIIAIYQDSFVAITGFNRFQICDVKMLSHYASLKQPKEKIALYRTINNHGNIEVCDKNGTWVRLDTKELLGHGSPQSQVRKANRQKDPCAYLDPDTFEIEWV